MKALTRSCAVVLAISLIWGGTSAEARQQPTLGEAIKVQFGSWLPNDAEAKKAVEAPALQMVAVTPGKLTFAEPDKLSWTCDPKPGMTLTPDQAEAARAELKKILVLFIDDEVKGQILPGRGMDAAQRDGFVLGMLKGLETKVGGVTTQPETPGSPQAVNPWPSPQSPMIWPSPQAAGGMHYAARPASPEVARPSMSLAGPELGSTDPIALFGRGYNLYFEHDYPLALEHLRASARLAPNDPRVWYYKSLAELAVGDRDAAEQSLSNGASAQLRAGEGRYKLGQALERLSGPARDWIGAGVVREQTARLEMSRSRRLAGVTH